MAPLVIFVHFISMFSAGVAVDLRFSLSALCRFNHPLQESWLSIAWLDQLYT